MMGPRHIAAALVAALALTACGKAGERVRFDGNYYPAKLSQQGNLRENFAVTVDGAAQGINGAREAGRYEATRYCVETFGDSDITWQPGYGPEGGAAITDNGSLILRGACVKW